MKTLVITVLAAALVATAAAQKITTFSVPGAGTGQGQGTFPTAINSTGLVAGYYSIPNTTAFQGFTRSVDGNISTFAAFGSQSFATFVTGLSDNGYTVGSFNLNKISSDGVLFGFLRSPKGAFTRIAGTKATEALTYATAVNSSGQVTGQWTDSPNNPWNGYVWQKGVLTSFNVTGASTTAPLAINSSGEIAGYYDDINDGFNQGFLRDPQGNIATFSIPGANSTVPTSINDSGEVAGYSIAGTNNDQFSGFVRSSDGTLTSYSINGATQFYGTQGGTPVLNSGGEVAGSVLLANGAITGYQRSPAGKISEFQITGDTTEVTGINRFGHLTGNYESKQVFYGFVF